MLIRSLPGWLAIIGNFNSDSPVRSSLFVPGNSVDNQRAPLLSANVDKLLSYLFNLFKMKFVHEVHKVNDKKNENKNKNDYGCYNASVCIHNRF